MTMNSADIKDSSGQNNKNNKNNRLSCCGKTFSCVGRVSILSLKQLTIALVRPLWMAVDWAWHTMSSPAGVSNAEVNIKLHVQVNILLL